MAERWFPTLISQFNLTDGFEIVLTTDVPCHLWLYWTDKVPWVHRTSTIERGLAVPWDTYWCYVVWQIIEQDEAGDTLTHTFQWPAWSHCQTKYFRFHGTIGGETSPSDSPIFHKHFEYYDPPIIVKEHFDPGPFPDITGIIGDNWAGYAFTAESSYTLDHIKCYFTRRELMSHLYVKLYNAAADFKPTGLPLAEATIHNVGLNFWPDYSSRTIPLGGVFLTAGQKYAITMHIEQSYIEYGWALWHSKAPNPYKQIRSNDAGNTWSVGNAVWQTMFKHWGA